ncbi:DUF3053 family protein [Camelimonas fluminis]|uniref:DUF3053 family protein n=1 Tax=Camelimonas fluminis TaxID=1576911 RepID=A0ABV7UN49_9HYPH|nr:DUF3053 family protein [Camelimonas fluminis]
MSPLFRSIVVALVMPLLLAACGDKEPEQRKAFIELLDQRVIKPAGVRLPKLNDEEKTKLGETYKAQFDIISNFHEGLNTTFAAIPKVMSNAALRKLDDLPASRKALEEARGALKSAGDAMDAAEKKAVEAKAALKQPDDLKAAYDKAFDKMITAPVAAARNLFGSGNAVIDTGVQLIDYLGANKDKVTFTGGALQASDPKAHAEVNALLAKLNAASQKLASDVQTLNKIGRGQ